MSFSVEIDAGLCMGAQRCSYVTNGVFELDDDGIAEVVDPTHLSLEQAELAANECPNLAITVRHGHERSAHR
jgi:ferredoxin